MRRRPLAARLRYRFGQWDHGPRWAEHAQAGEPWYGFERVKLIDGLKVEIAMIPLFGHTAGHSGYAIHSGERWLLHAGDAYLRHGEIASPPRSTRALDAYHALNSDDGARRHENVERLAALARDHQDSVTVFCSHDPAEFRRDTAGPQVAREERQSLRSPAVAEMVGGRRERTASMISLGSMPCR